MISNVLPPSLKLRHLWPTEDKAELEFRRKTEGVLSEREILFRKMVNKIYGDGDPLGTFRRQAIETDSPDDQIDNLVRNYYAAQPKQLEFHAAARECDKPDGPTAVGYGGTRGQAKSHAVIAQVGMDDCQRVDGLKWLYLRKVQKAAGEQIGDLIGKIFKYTPHEYRPSTGFINFSNGSKIVVGGFKDERDIDRYIGIEYDGIVIEDATTLTRQKIDQILGSLRTSKPDWRPRWYAPANPGGVGHGWYREQFYDPWVRKQETDTRFIHTRLGDNVFINPEYEAYLENLTGFLRRCWLDGDFSVAAGQYFNTFDETIHVIDPFEIPADWRFTASLDYGWQHPTVVYLLAEAGETVYVIGEHYANKTPVENHAEHIKALLSTGFGLTTRDLRSFVAGSDVFAESRKDGGTIARDYAEHGIRLSMAKTARVQGARELTKRLGDPRFDKPPTIKIFNTCHRLIWTIPQMLHDPKNPEDVLKFDADDNGDFGDDPYDGLRYGLLELAGPRGWTRGSA